MARLSYSMQASLDGYIADEHGTFDWAAPDAEVHAFINDLERPIGTYLYGRRMYQTMVAWETLDPAPDDPPAIADYARIWRAADKVVYSATLATAGSARTRIESTFDPVAVQSMKAAADRDLSIGGPALAAHALRAGVVDEIAVFVYPVIVGGGSRLLPDGLRARLRLRDQRRFGSGVVYLRYEVTP